MSTKWPYVAGLLDGEGCICLHERKPNNQSAFFIQVVIYNTSLTLMKWLVGNFGGKFYVRTKEGSPLSKKMQYVWHPSGKKNRESFLLGVIPYLVVKQEQAKIGLAFLRLGYGEQEKRRELTQKCCLLNRGEESATTNTFDASEQSEVKIESELVGDYESALDVNQGFAE